MAKKTVRGITVEIDGDTKKFNKAIDGLNKDLSKTSRSLKAVNDQLKLDPSNVELLASKERLLAQQLEKTEEQYKLLRKAQEDANVDDAKYEEWEKALSSIQGQITKTVNEISKLNKEAKKLETSKSEEDGEKLAAILAEIAEKQKGVEALQQSITDTYDAMNRPISTEMWDNLVLKTSKAGIAFQNAKAESEDFRKSYVENVDSMSDLAIAIEEASEATDDMADALDETSEGADNAAGSFDEAADSVDGTGSALSTLGDIAKHAVGELLADAIETVLSSLKDLGVAIWNLDEATEEYRIAQGKLNTAFEAAGYGPDAASKAYSEFYKILGDTDTATEASQLLATLAENEAELTTWTNIAAGVAGTFGDALPIEGLIEAANETAKTGKVTGALADALNWAGISEDEFNDGLSYLGTESARNYRIMQTLSGIYDEAAEAFYRNNDAVITARENQIELDDAMSTVGETISNIKNSFLTELSPVIANVADKFAELAQRVDWEEMAEKIGVFIGKIDFDSIFLNMENAINNIDFDALFNTIDDVVSNLITLGEIVSPVIKLVVGFATKLFDLFQNMSPEAKNMTFAIIGAVLAIRTVGGALNDVGRISSLFSSGPGNKMYVTFVKWAAIITTVVLAVTALIAMINVLFGKSKDVSSAMNSIGGVTSGGAQIGAIPRQSGAPLAMASSMLDDFPHFADGGVFAPNNPMLGVLGDNRTEYEVAAPESTIRDASREGMLDALSTSGLMGGQRVSVDVRFSGTMAQFVRQLYPMITAETTRLGPALAPR